MTTGVFIIMFLVACTGWILLMRRRGGGDGSGTGVDNHNAVQNGAAKINSTRNRSGGSSIP